MIEFKLTIFRQRRILLSGLVFIIFMLLLLTIGSKIETPVLKILFIVLTISIVVLILFYYSVGYLTVYIKDNELNFKWDSKFFFNYKEINSIKIHEIETIIIDNDELLKSIITTDKEILIGNGQLFKKDSQNFINYLNALSKDENIRIISSWDVWKEKGALKIAYTINLIVLIIVVLVVTVLIFITGFHSKYLLFMPLVISQLFFYQQIMKNKMK
jgi:hypothetical protein